MGARTRIAMILADGGDLSFFTSLEAAGNWLEPDYLDDIDTAYGPAGEIYDPIADTWTSRFSLSDQPARPEELRGRIHGFLKAVGEPAQPDESLEALLLRCERYIYM